MVWLALSPKLPGIDVNVTSARAAGELDQEVLSSAGRSIAELDGVNGGVVALGAADHVGHFHVRHRVVRVGEKEHDVRPQRERESQGRLAGSASLGRDAADEIRRQPFVAIRGKSDAPLPAGKIPSLRLVIKENDLKLVHALQCVEAGHELLFGGGQGGAEGNIVACGNLNTGGEGSAVYVYSPEGEIQECHPVPVDQPTNCGFGSHDLRSLYVTTESGKLYRVSNTDRQGCARIP